MRRIRLEAKFGAACYHTFIDEGESGPEDAGAFLYRHLVFRFFAQEGLDTYVYRECTAEQA